MTIIYYIHGFSSSPQSHKARLIGDVLAARRMSKNYRVPKLSYDCLESMARLVKCIESENESDIALIGSSMGGYYATYLANRYDLKAVLINPAVKPYSLLESYLGPIENPYTGERFEITSAELSKLKSLDVEDILRPKNFWVMVQSGDETLDYREAITKFPRSKQTIEPGGSHAFERFEDYVPAILNFLGCVDSHRG